jgi:hypothetical protein
MKNIIQNSQYSVRHLKPEPPEYEAHDHDVRSTGCYEPSTLKTELSQQTSDGHGP